LSPETKAALDSFVQKLIADKRGVYLEIQGHTDGTGPAEYNLLLGKKRADAVMEYLYKQYHVPLHRMQEIKESQTPITVKDDRFRAPIERCPHENSLIPGKTAWFS
jgi:hypothetical protein